MKQFNVRLDEDTITRIKKLALYESKNTGFTIKPADIVRKAIKKYLLEVEKYSEEKERRRFKRYSAKVNSLLAINVSTNDKEWNSAWALNISEGGIKLSSKLNDESITRAHPIKMRFVDHHNHVISDITGKLMWYNYLTNKTKLAEMGIEFTNTEKAITVINELMHQLADIQ